MVRESTDGIAEGGPLLTRELLHKRVEATFTFPGDLNVGQTMDLWVVGVSSLGSFNFGMEEGLALLSWILGPFE